MQFFTEEDVRVRLKMADVIPAVEAALRDLATGTAANLPRRRAKAGRAMIHDMAAADERLRVLGAKTYVTGPAGAHFVVTLFDATTSQPIAMVQADFLGQLRTGAASGVATKYLARADATTVGVFGTGKQARTQLEAVCLVRGIRQARVFSRDSERRSLFASEMGAACGVEVVPANRPEDAANADIVITATTSRTPVLSVDWIRPGAHLNVVGSNYPEKAEVDAATVRRSRVIVDSIEACQAEAGELIQAAGAGAYSWSNCTELGAVLAGTATGRQSTDQITLFKSVGLAIEDIAAAKLLCS